MKISNKLKLERFFKEQIWQLLLVVAVLFFFAWLFDKYIECIMFCTAHQTIRPSFGNQYHRKETYLCIFLTLSIGWFGISTILPIAVSVLSSIPLAFIICLLGNIAQDRVDYKILNVKLQSELDQALARINQLENIDLYKMTEEELRQYGSCLGLSDIQQDILVHRVIDNLKISEICDTRGYGRTTIKYHIKEIKRKLNIEKI